MFTVILKKNTIVMSDPNQPNTINALYCENHLWLRSLLLRKLGNQQDAADLTHDAFVRLLKAPQSFENCQNARNYLSTIAKNLCIDFWRKQEIIKIWQETIISRGEQYYPSAEQQSAAIELLCEFDRLLMQQKPKAANAFTLAVIQGKKDKEVAQIMGISDRMVRRYVARVLLAFVKFECAE
ncbi:MAG: RNA polymerase sigma factor [Pseudomonadota bacterium]